MVNTSDPDANYVRAAPSRFLTKQAPGRKRFLKPNHPKQSVRRNQVTRMPARPKCRGLHYPKPRRGALGGSCATLVVYALMRLGPVKTVPCTAFTDLSRSPARHSRAAITSHGPV